MPVVRSEAQSPVRVQTLIRGRSRDGEVVGNRMIVEGLGGNSRKGKPGLAQHETAGRPRQEGAAGIMDDGDGMEARGNASAGWVLVQGT